jgi:DNA-binding NtrC family response regulator
MNLDVLIADQDIKLARLYGQFLDENAISARAVWGGLECLRMIRELNPSILVLDHELPWRDSEGVLACLRADKRALPVILTTWDARPHRVDQLMVPPVIRCLQKFFPLAMLIATIERGLRTVAVSKAAGRAGLQRPHGLLRRQRPDQRSRPVPAHRQ